MASILVVEDKESTRQLLTEYLGISGHVVIPACDGVEAIDAVRRGAAPIDLVLMDVQMPEVDGFQAAAEMRSLGLQAPIVFLTALAMSGDRERCLSAGGDGYLSKPFRLRDLNEVIDRFLPGSSASGTP